MITRYKLKKRRAFRTKNHTYRNSWSFQYSIKILDFEEAREILKIQDLKITAWQVYGVQKDDFIKFSFRSEVSAREVITFLPIKFHENLNQDF